MIYTNLHKKFCESLPSILSEELNSLETNDNEIIEE